MLNQPIATDVDFFFKTQEAFEAFVENFGGNESKRLAATEHHTTFKATVGKKTYKVQAIKIGFYATSRSDWTPSISPSASSLPTKASFTSASIRCGIWLGSDWLYTS